MGCGEGGAPEFGALGFSVGSQFGVAEGGVGGVEGKLVEALGVTDDVDGLWHGEGWEWEGRGGRRLSGMVCTIFIMLEAGLLPLPRIAGSFTERRLVYTLATDRLTHFQDSLCPRRLHRQPSRISDAALRP